jgi:hypothetical protein
MTARKKTQHLKRHHKRLAVFLELEDKGLSLTSISLLVGLSRERVRQLLNKAWVVLRKQQPPKRKVPKLCSVCEYRSVQSGRMRCPECRESHLYRKRASRVTRVCHSAICPRLGLPFEILESHVKYGEGIYCSKTCQGFGMRRPSALSDSEEREVQTRVDEALERFPFTNDEYPLLICRRRNCLAQMMHWHSPRLRDQAFRQLHQAIVLEDERRNAIPD